MRHILESYHYIHKQSAVDMIRRDGVKVFLDSGAFSAMTKGVEIDLRGYCHYIQKNADIIEHYSVLDGIGDPLKTWQNQQLMESLGVRPLPCFHYGEDERYLEWYISNYEYITLGGMVPISTPQLYNWLDRIWGKYLTDGAGKPRVKVHGFGVTTFGIMERYPWFSVDSSRWVMAAAMGTVILPKVGIISVSEHSPTKKRDGAHLDNLPTIHQDVIAKMIEAYGFEVERVRTEYLSRWAFNCGTFQDIEDETTKHTWHFERLQPELFDG